MIDFKNLKYIGMIVFLSLSFLSCKQGISKNESATNKSEGIQVDTLTSDGIHIKGKLINGIRQGMWTFETDSYIIKRLYVSGDMVFEETNLNDNDSIVEFE